MFAFLECDVLILDEVLAVGDIFFRQKCYARLEELIAHNTAIILVTHSTGTVRQYCDDVIVLDKGKIYYHGTSTESIQKYFEIKKELGIKIDVSDTYVEEDYIPARDDRLMARKDVFDWPTDSVFNSSNLPQKSENKRAKLTHLAVCDERGIPCHIFKQGATACLYYAFQVKENIGVPIAGVNLFTVKNLFVHSKNSIQLKIDHPRNLRVGDVIRYKQLIKLDLAPGNYIFNLSLSTMHPEDFGDKENLSIREFREKLVQVIGIKPAGAIQVVAQSHNQTIGLHGGIVNLEGEIQVQIVPAP